MMSLRYRGIRKVKVMFEEYLRQNEPNKAEKAQIYGKSTLLAREIPEQQPCF